MAIPILKVAITVIFILSLTIPPSRSAETEDLLYGSKDVNMKNIEEKKKMVVGSRPPKCMNKCLSCRPCMATLVVTTHQNKLFRISSFQGDDDNYYLLSWKCKCGNKIFQP